MAHVLNVQSRCMALFILHPITLLKELRDFFYCDSGELEILTQMRAYLQDRRRV